jgi:putative hydrolase of the HAD superfamily
MNFEALFFDLDDTLYPHTSGIWQAIGHRMDLYMVEKLDLALPAVPHLRESLYSTYGTTMRGLEAVYHIDTQEFLDFVHDIPVNHYIQRDESLRKTLAMYSERKIIFTNADTNHAIRVLSTLGVSEFFDQVVDIRDMRPFCKPQKEAFARAMELTGITNPANCLLMDDTYPNLVTAHELGMFTIHVGTDIRAPLVDAAINTLNDLPSVIPINALNTTKLESSLF